jgi:murein DD-endopeptidase MepM/ murein hydrolase activator NlpD
MRPVVRRSIVVLALLVLMVPAGMWLAVRYNVISSQSDSAQIDPVPTEATFITPSPAHSPSPFPSASIAEATPTPEPSSSNELQPPQNPLGNTFVGTVNLIIPVAGVRPDQLLDTFDDARSEGRVHDAIDIPAPAGTPVLAASDGQILKLFQSERGGTTIYQLSSDKKLVFYYAHLQQYAANITQGMTVRQGDVIAYVGDTGNAGPGNYHLHFSIAIVSDPKRYWEGTNINPYPLLHH